MPRGFMPCRMRSSIASKKRRGVSSFVSLQRTKSLRTLRSVKRRPFSGRKPSSFRIAAICAWCDRACAQIDHALLQLFVGVVAFADRARLDVTEPQAQVVDEALGPAFALRWWCPAAFRRCAISRDANILRRPCLELSDHGQLRFIINQDLHARVVRSRNCLLPIRRLAEVVAALPNMVDRLASAFARRLPLHLREDQQDVDQRAAQRRVEPDRLARIATSSFVPSPEIGLSSSQK